MKGKAICFYVSVIILAFALIACIVAIVIGDAAAMLLNMGIGILSSGLVSSIIILSEYFIQKREVLVNYYEQLNDIILLFRTLKYCEINEETELTAKYLAEVSYNKQLRKNSQEECHIAFEQLGKYYYDYMEWDDSRIHFDDPRLQKFIEDKANNTVQKVKNCIQSYFKVAEYNITELVATYNKIYYLVYPKKHRNTYYEYYLKPVLEHYKSIQSRVNWPLRLFYDEDSVGLINIISYIEGINQDFFTKELITSKDGCYYCVYPVFFNEMMQKLNGFYEKVFHTKRETITTRPIMFWMKKEKREAIDHA